MKNCPIKVVNSIHNLPDQDVRKVSSSNIDQINESEILITQNEEEGAAIYNLDYESNCNTACFNDYDSEESALFLG